MTITDRFERVEVTSARALDAWLAANHAQNTAIWLVTWKKHAAGKYVSRDEVLDSVLAWGWIDGRRAKLDADRTMQLLAPRRTGDWAQSYKERAARLIAEGRMRAPGQAAVDRAIAAGLWDASTDVDRLTVPGDLAAALVDQSPAARHFAAFAPSTRRNILRWIAAARRAETRARRIATTATLAARNETPPQI